ncbi:uncharacterized protein LOC113230229 isoform X1 [Hyposmocoma kahamanoa]|uniref:uncharacterized protein LOC113230229 isoform X1 n=2 Tax=Hyposmocoma kahamanoa TaxID=1477025 RepID=UPI000E6D911C|nr:uncharacterized protein LOC113230229 isoform X1 [Hyposmocoma kahamanoa]
MRKFYLLCAIFCIAEGSIPTSIPNHLLECYWRGGPPLGAPRRLDVLLSLMKKLENSIQLDMRMFSTSLLQSLRLDGIERAGTLEESDSVLPYRATAFQFHKYKILMEIFLPSQNLLQVNETLTVGEGCFLHRMLSSTVQQWERGDENLVCPVTAEQRQSMVTQSSIRVHSRCPIEDGVVQTEWGTISPGTLIAAIASSLQAQIVLITDILNAKVFQEDVAEPLLTSAKQEWIDNIETLDEPQVARQTETASISNIWVATLAGDLAEVVLNQGPRTGAVPQRMTVGSNSRWNDTLLPRNHYLITQNASIVDWHFTDAEILAGIDGLILSQYVPSWVEQRKTLKLSQIIDMYYSDEGVSFQPTVKACNRQMLFNTIFNSSDLLQETMRFASILSLQQITVYIPVEEMERLANAAVTAFGNYLPSVLRQNQRMCQASHSVPVMDLIVATDAAWKGYDVEQFISWAGGALELDLRRSTLSLLHGNTGQYIVPPSDNLTAVFSHLSNYTDEWPTRLSVSNVISATIQHSLNKTLLEKNTTASAGPSTVVLIISPSDRPSVADIEAARELMNSLRMSYFDVYFAYTAQDLTEFQNINNEYLDYSELFLAVASSNVQDVISTVDTLLVKSEIPSRIFGAHCPFNGTVFNQTEYEDFVLPSRTRTYRIHPFYLMQQPLVNVQFRNAGQGRLLICMWRGAKDAHSQSCQNLGDRDRFNFNLTNPCTTPQFCLPAYFSVSVFDSTNICAHNDCRLPNQVGYYLEHTGLRCLPLRSYATCSKNSVFIISSFILFLFYKTC